MTKTPELIDTIAELRSRVRKAKSEGKKVGFVPTMGALHEGHLSLVRASTAECDATVVSIYVNPTQFGRGEDFDRYPRTLPRDIELLTPLGVDWVFAPSDAEMYPEGFDTWVTVGKVAEPWEGACRPGHFRGVATVVLKLFTMVEPDIAYFGEKDYQQLAVVRRMTIDLNLPVEIRGCPIVREPDGLAMSSRNQYLDEQQRQEALVLSQSLKLASDMVARGETDAAQIIAEMERHIRSARSARIDYVAIVDPETFESVGRVDRPVQALLAVRIGDTRLIDNARLTPPKT
ncbi:MAG: pantoate--beta-alanine ligase [Planctomycetota bacterium]|nr:MAG: pantoate--beta-alanine ligase [Planctomycetota bacterium]